MNYSFLGGTLVVQSFISQPGEKEPESGTEVQTREGKADRSQAIILLQTRLLLRAVLRLF